MYRRYCTRTIFYLIFTAQAAEAFGLADFQFISCLDTRNETKKIKAPLAMTLVYLLNLSAAG